MQKISKRIGLFLIALLISLNVAGALPVNAKENDKQSARVLFISSYAYGWDTTQLQIEGIQDGLDASVVLDYEFMDTKRVADDTATELFYEGLKYRLEHVAPYDVIILGDDAALLFALEHREELFPDTPLVFEAVNDKQLAMDAAEDPLITGVLEVSYVEKNIELGLQFTPDAKKVVAILDDSVTGQAEREHFYSYAEQFPELEFTEINTSEKTTEELKTALSHVSEDSILIYVVMTEDTSGKQYTNRESMQLIAEVASVPAICMVEVGIADGLLGGHIVSMHESGRMAAQIAMDIIEGKDIREIDVVMDSPNIYILDEQVIKKFDIDMSVIPEGATIVNHESSFAERNKEVLIPGSLVIVTLLFIIFWVVYDNFHRRKLMKELEKARAIMESASQHDFLTGLSNRSKFMKDLKKLIDNETPCTVMMLDIDDFKKINDTYGHAAGDEALQQVAARLCVMESNIFTPYRFAGDEFIIILESGQSKVIERIACQCRQIFSEPFVLCGEKRKICGSIGVASYPKDTDNLEQLIVCADDAMYRVKKSGKNDFAYYSSEGWV